MEVERVIEILSGSDKVDYNEYAEAKIIACKLLKTHMPQKPSEIDEFFGSFICPNCGNTSWGRNTSHNKYCGCCGQKIDWEKE